MRRLLHRHYLLVLAIDTGPYALKVFANVKRKPESARVLGIKRFQQRPERAGVRTKAVSELEAHVAKPVSRHAILKQRRVDAGQVECPSAAIAAQQFTVAAARRAIVIIIVLKPRGLEECHGE